MSKQAHSGNADMDAIERQGHALEDAANRAMTRQEAEDRKAKHSPLPWRIQSECISYERPEGINAFIKICSPWIEGAWEGDAEAAANAAFICKAVNNHEALLEALRPFAEPHAMGDNYVKFAPRLIEAARAAIAKASGDAA